ncbi:MAG TPA: hypothetical protein VHZ81_08640 [Galbitalea sp.]|jgi:hypothetical protein|nr:hypothetical protein [Galbitalea sp.]
MNFFKQAAEHLGYVDHKLVASGTLARGEVVSVVPGAFTSGEDTYTHTGGSTVCRVTVNVIGVPGKAPYQANFLAPIPDDQLGILELAGTAIAVRVDPNDPQNIALDAQTEAPAATATTEAPSTTSPPADVATLHGQEIMVDSNDGTSIPLPVHVGKLTAAEVLAQGAPCTVDVLAVIPMDQKDSHGRDVLGMILKVHRDGKPDVQAQIATHVPPEVASKVVVGATLPAKYTPGLDTGDDTVIPDWSQIAA